MKPSVFLLATFFILTATSCSKEKSEQSEIPENPACRITDIQGTDQHYKMTYDAEGRLSSVVYNDNDGKIYFCN